MMGIFSRLSDIINSNINALLDRAENPEKLLRNIVQEMEDTLVEVRSQAAQTIAERKRLNRHANMLTGKQQEWADRATLAVNRGRDDLAKLALVEKTRLEDMLEDVQVQQTHFDEILVKYNDDIALLESKMQDARHRQRELLRRQQAAVTTLRVQEKTSNSRLEHVLQQMERLERGVDSLEARAESHGMGVPQQEDQSLEKTIDGLVEEERITKELAKLKSQIQKCEGEEA